MSKRLPPERWALRYDNDQGGLLCPQCDEGYANHLDVVRISARYEDCEPDEISIDAITGRVQTKCPIPAPIGKQVGSGRRHRIALMGWCELCGASWALIFTQQKGTTYVEVMPSEDGARSWGLRPRKRAMP
jgi:hypothetical protein